jgi:hypothetical protein
MYERNRGGRPPDKSAAPEPPRSRVQKLYAALISGMVTRSASCRRSAAGNWSTIAH